MMKGIGMVVGPSKTELINFYKNESPIEIYLKGNNAEIRVRDECGFADCRLA
jgi:hypothetical protein